MCIQLETACNNSLMPMEIVRSISEKTRKTRFGPELQKPARSIQAYMIRRLDGPNARTTGGQCADTYSFVPRGRIRDVGSSHLLRICNLRGKKDWLELSHYSQSGGSHPLRLRLGIVYLTSPMFGSSQHHTIYTRNSRSDVANYYIVIESTLSGPSYCTIKLETCLGFISVRTA